MTLYYPKWIPGTHGPSGPIADLAGLKIQAGGKAVAWKRDDIDMYAFHCTVPESAAAIEGRRWTGSPPVGAALNNHRSYRRGPLE